MISLDNITWRGLNKLVAIQQCNDSSGFRALQAKKTRDAIQVVQSVHLQNTTELAEWLKAKGRCGILWVAQAEAIVEGWVNEYDKPAILTQLLGVPIDRLNDFSLSFLPGKSTGGWASLIRREALDKANTQLGKYAEQLVGVSLSPVGLCNLLPQLYPQAAHIQLQLGPQTYAVSHGQIGMQEATELTVTEVELAKALGIEIPFLPHYAAVFEQWLSLSQVELPPAWEESRGQFIQVSKLLNIASLAMILLLTGAIISFGTRTYAQWKTDQYRQEYTQYLPMVDQVRTQEGMIAEKQSLLTHFTQKTLRGSRVSYFSDQIGIIVPPAITLKSLIFYPTEEDREQYRIPENNEADLVMLGNSIHAHPIPAFSARLKTLDFVAELEVGRSDFNFTKNRFEFLFLMKLSHAG